MAIDDWVFPKLEANLGAWRRFWVQQVVLPNFGRDIVHDTPLAGYAQYLSTSSVKRMMLDTISRAEAKSEKRALKALQNGADVRDLPGSDVAIASLRQVYQEIQHWTTTEFVEGNFYHLMERLSTAVMSYTYCPNLEPRLCDRLIGPQGRQIADSVSRAWMSYPVFQFLNQPFHPAFPRGLPGCPNRQTRGLARFGDAAFRWAAALCFGARRHESAHFPLLHQLHRPHASHRGCPGRRR